MWVSMLAVKTLVHTQVKVGYSWVSESHMGESGSHMGESGSHAGESGLVCWLGRPWFSVVWPVLG